MGLLMSNVGVQSHKTEPVAIVDMLSDDDESKARRKSPPETMVPKRGRGKRTGKGRRVGAKRQTTRRTPAAVSAAVSAAAEADRSELARTSKEPAPTSRESKELHLSRDDYVE